MSSINLKRLKSLDQWFDYVVWFRDGANGGGGEGMRISEPQFQGSVL